MFTRSPLFQRGPSFDIFVNGRPVAAHAGESLAAALLASGVRTFRVMDGNGEPRAPFCGMGACFECLVTVDGQPNIRACATPARPGLRVEIPASGND